MWHSIDRLPLQVLQGREVNSWCRILDASRPDAVFVDLDQGGLAIDDKALGLRGNADHLDWGGDVEVGCEMEAAVLQVCSPHEVARLDDD